MTLERWEALRPRQIEEELRRAHGLIFEKLPKRVKILLALPEKERKQVIGERKKKLVERAKVAMSKSSGGGSKRKKAAG